MKEEGFKIKNFAVISRLIKTIESKKNYDTSKSYVSKLLNAKDDLLLKKLGEEAIEVILAAKTGKKKELVSEVADLLFHLLVVLQSFGVELDDVFEEIQKREGVSGIDEKNSRPTINDGN